jgi:hypothetical protein
MNLRAELKVDVRVTLMRIVINNKEENCDQLPLSDHQPCRMVPVTTSVR